MLVDGSTTQDARREDAEALLSRLQSIPEQDDWPIFKRQNQFEATVADVQALLTYEVSENRTETVRTQLAIALNSVVTLETQGGAFGDRQAASVAGLKAQLGEAQAVLDAFLVVPETTKLEAPEPLLSSGAAITKYWPRLTPQILAAVGVDLAILWVAAFLAVSRAETQAAVGRITRRARSDVRNDQTRSQTGGPRHAV